MANYNMTMWIIDKKDGDYQWQYIYNSNSKKNNDGNEEVLIKN